MRCLINNMFNKNKIAIIVQGTSNYVPEVKYAWKNFKDDIIFSTWKGGEDKYNSNDNVLFNNEPDVSGPFNFNYQKVSTYNGLLRAKQLKYTHALKIRSDYLPTNPKKFIKLLDFDKLNFLMWNYPSFLWLDYPNLNGYLDDHFSFGPIDDMIELWDIKNNFCHSPEIMLTWSYISKLKDKIDIKYILPHLDTNNDLYYIKFNNYNKNNKLSHNEINNNFSDKELYGRYESVFKDMNEYNITETKSKKFMTDDYLTFLKYYHFLPKITIYDPHFLIHSNNKLVDELKNIIYPENKLEVVSNMDNMTGEYIICADDIKNNSTLIIEYFKKLNIVYSSTTESVPEKNNNKKLLLTIDEHKNNKNI